MSGEAPRRYHLIRQLAKGGMGEIWLAKATGAAGWQKPVVVKRVLPHLEDDPEFLTRFIDEARISASLSHGNIVPVFDLGEDDGMYFIAMEWVDGWDLRKLLRILKSADERLPLHFALYVAAAIADGLAYAHTRTDEAGVPLRIVHRDVSPSNILISRDGEVKITDFGIASARERLGRTVTGQLRGKFAYMSPEQALGQPVDQRSDVFALGALLFEMVSGEKAFDGGSDMGTLERVRSGDRATSSQELPDELVAVIDRALAVDPDQRFESAEAFAESLQRLLHTAEEPVTSRAFARFLKDTFQADPVLAAQAAPGGASLDAILNAQLDANGTPTPSMTDSSRLLLPTSSSNSARLQLASPSASAAAPQVSHTVTHAIAPQNKKQRGAAVAIALLLLLVCVAALALVPRPAQVSVETTPSGASVYIDGVLEGISDISAKLEPGTHTIRLQLEGYDPLELEIEAERGQTINLEEALRPSDLAIVFDSVPGGATVTVNGEAIEAGNALTVPVGVALDVRMELPGHETYSEEHVFSVGDRILTRQLTPILAANQANVDEESGTSEQAGSAETSTTPNPRNTDRRTERRSDAGPDDRREPDGGEDGREAERDSEAEERNDTEQEAAEPTPEEELTARLRVRFGELPGVGRISIDGRDMGENSDVSETFRVSPGTHEVVVTNALGGRYQTTVDVAANESRTVNVVWRSE